MKLHKRKQKNNLLNFSYNITMYYNYHGIIKRKIKNKELIKVEYQENYKKIGKVLLLYFKDGSIYPIREYRFLEYSIILNKYFDKDNI